MNASEKAGRGSTSSASSILERGVKKKSAGWSSVREQLREWPQSALMTLIKDLYDSSPTNRAFLHARFQAEEARVPRWRHTGARLSSSFSRRVDSGS